MPGIGLRTANGRRRRYRQQIEEMRPRNTATVARSALLVHTAMR
jgi:hypothetical protein